jgi:hypothetical protein
MGEHGKAQQPWKYFSILSQGTILLTLKNIILLITTEETKWLQK